VAFIKEPRKTCLLLSRLPIILRGLRYCKEWQTSNTKDASELPSGTSLPIQSNPLKSYFDSHTEGKIIHKWLHYFEIYHRYFKKFRGRDVHILEVGVARGGSLEMWRDYFGPKSNIYGIDINEKCTANNN